MADATAPQVLALLRDIKEHPEDDTPRLVLADWLQEFGTTESVRARGEFIYLQCRLAAREDAGLAREAVERREYALWSAYGDDWLGPWRDWADRGNFFRGLLRLAFRGLGWKAGERQDPAAWVWVDGLLVRELDAPAARELASSPCLAHLLSLDLSGNPFSDEGARALAASPHLANLRMLELNLTEIGDGGVAALASSPHLAGLTSLSLWDNRISAAGAEALASSRHLANLGALDLGSNHIGDEGALAFVHSPHLSRLSTLDLTGNGIDEARAALRQRFGGGVRV
jgi:uncharacterized protein (TIGR02996 family)